jgi:hypothetical protein
MADVRDFRRATDPKRGATDARTQVSERLLVLGRLLAGAGGVTSERSGSDSSGHFLKRRARTNGCLKAEFFTYQSGGICSAIPYFM